MIYNAWLIAFHECGPGVGLICNSSSAGTKKSAQSAGKCSLHIIKFRNDFCGSARQKGGPCEGVNGGKQMEIPKRGLPAFVVFPAFPQSGEKHRFAWIFCALFDQAKSAGKQCKTVVNSLLT